MTREPAVAPERSGRGPEEFVAYERFLDCVHCGLCLNACPTYLELGTEMDSPRGRIYLMRGLAEGALSLSPDVARHLDLCLGCRACETACPSGVRYGELIEGARAFVERHHSRGLLDRLRRRAIEWVFPHARRLRLVLAPIRLLQRLGIWRMATKLFPAAAMIPGDPPAPVLPAVIPSDGAERARVGLLTGCVAQVLFGGTNHATARVLARNGFTTVAAAAQGCCGALSLHNGSRAAALDFARRTIDAFATDLDAVLANAAGCGAMLRQYGELLADDPAYAERAARFSAKVRDATEWLAGRLVQKPPAIPSVRLTYHDACHLAHGQQVRDQPRALLRAIPGVELVELPESDLCCGSAGSYNLTEPAMAERLQGRKVDNIAATNVDAVVAANPGCILQIRAGLRRRGMALPVLHPIDVLDRAYRGQPLISE
jgi:glycolate oxidase iron-sulfur subunit